MMIGQQTNNEITKLNHNFLGYDFGFGSIRNRKLKKGFSYIISFETE